MPVNNDQFLMSTLAISALPVNANECLSIQTLDVPAIPNSIPAKYYIIFQMNDGTEFKWLYGSAVSRNIEFASVQSAVTTNVAPSYDPDAQTFITATGITGIEATAVNQLVLDLKSYSLWSPALALYPIVGTSSSQQRENLVNPGTFQLDFQGSWNHTSTGAEPDGATAYADTQIVPSSEITDINKFTALFYSRTNVSGLQADVGSYNSALITRIEIMTRLGSNYEGTVNANTTGSFAVADSLGLFSVSRTTNISTDTYKNGALLSNFATPSTNLSTYPIYIGARNLDGSPSAFSTRECAFAGFYDGILNATDNLNLYTSIQNFQTTLGRNV